eukprot:Opistho-2@6444
MPIEVSAGSNPRPSMPTGSASAGGASTRATAGANGARLPNRGTGGRGKQPETGGLRGGIPGAKKRTAHDPKKRAEVETLVRERIEAERQAFQMQLKLIDGPVDASALLAAANHIQPSHYADIVEERHIARVCGYPLCSNRLPREDSKGIYKISLPEKKVYDVRELRSFCHKECLAASKYFESQLSDTAVWLRKDWPICSNISLLDHAKPNAPAPATTTTPANPAEAQQASHIAPDDPFADTLRTLSIKENDPSLLINAHPPVAPSQSSVHPGVSALDKVTASLPIPRAVDSQACDGVLPNSGRRVHFGPPQVLGHAASPPHSTKPQRSPHHHRNGDPLDSDDYPSESDEDSNSDGDYETQPDGSVGAHVTASPVCALGDEADYDDEAEEEEEGGEGDVDTDSTGGVYSGVNGHRRGDALSDDSDCDVPSDDAGGSDSDGIMGGFFKPMPKVPQLGGFAALASAVTRWRTTQTDNFFSNRHTRESDEAGPRERVV